MDESLGYATSISLFISSLFAMVVYAVLLMDITQSALSTHSTFHTFVLYYGNPQVLQTPAKTVTGLSLFGGLGERHCTHFPIVQSLRGGGCAVGGAVQFFYAWRIWTLGRYAVNKIILSILVTVIVLVRLFAISLKFTQFDILLPDNGSCNCYISYCVLPRECLTGGLLADSR